MTGSGISGCLLLAFPAIFALSVGLRDVAHHERSSREFRWGLSTVAPSIRHEAHAISSAGIAARIPHGTWSCISSLLRSRRRCAIAAQEPQRASASPAPSIHFAWRNS